VSIGAILIQIVHVLLKQMAKNSCQIIMKKSYLPNISAIKHQIKAYQQ
jgi:hypothetical protein